MSIILQAGIVIIMLHTGICVFMYIKPSICIKGTHNIVSRSRQSRPFTFEVMGVILTNDWRECFRYD